MKAPPLPLTVDMPTYFKSDREIMIEVGYSARNHRLAMNITQQDLAVHSGVSRSCVRSFERGDSISTGNLVKIFRSLRLLQAWVDIIPPAEVNRYEQVVKALAKKRVAQRAVKRKDKK